MERLDFFGREISFRFKGLKTHKTQIGGFVTIAVYSLLLIRISFLVYYFASGENPTLLYQEREVRNPKRFDITPESFSITFGIMDPSYNYITDPTILYAEAVLESKKTVFNETTQEYQDNWLETPIKMEICTPELVDNDPSFFGDFSYLDQHYCFSKGQELYIEGEYHGDSFAQIYIYIKRCRGPQCQPESVIQSYLDDFVGEVIFTDVYVSPENKDKPFTKYVRDNFWENGPGFPQKVFQQMRNNYIESDYGFFTSDIHTDIFPSYSTMNQATTQVTGDIYSTFILRFEKKKENLYKRTYQNFLFIVSSLGGLLQSLTTFAIVSTFFLSQTHLNQELINNTFTFKETHESDSIQENRRSITANQKVMNKQLSQGKSTLLKDGSMNEQTIQTLVGKQLITQQSNNQLFPSRRKTAAMKNDPAQSKVTDKSEVEVVIETPAKRIKQIIRDGIEEKKKNESEQLQPPLDSPQASKSKTNSVSNSPNLLESTINQHSNSMNFNLFGYIKSLCFGYGENKKKKAIYEHSIDQLYHYLDVQWIINKLIEFDKLKRILLDDDQLLLFEYLPKPSICYSFKNSSVNFHNNQSFTASKQSKNEIDNLQKASQSFKRLKNKGSTQQVDKRIIKYLDDTYKDIFEEENQYPFNLEDVKVKNYDDSDLKTQNFYQPRQEESVQDEENATQVDENLRFHTLIHKSQQVNYESPHIQSFKLQLFNQSEQSSNI